MKEQDIDREPREADEPALKTIDRAARVLWVLARGSRAADEIVMCRHSARRGGT